jgi:hypothetical protein
MARPRRCSFAPTDPPEVPPPTPGGDRSEMSEVDRYEHYCNQRRRLFDLLCWAFYPSNQTPKGRRPLKRVMGEEGAVNASTACVPLVVGYLLIEAFPNVYNYLMEGNVTLVSQSFLLRKAAALSRNLYYFHRTVSPPNPSGHSLVEVRSEVTHCPPAIVECDFLCDFSTPNSPRCYCADPYLGSPHLEALIVHIYLCTPGIASPIQFHGVRSISFEKGSVEAQYDSCPTAEIPLRAIGCIPAAPPCELVARSRDWIESSELVPLNELLVEAKPPPAFFRHAAQERRHLAPRWRSPRLAILPSLNARLADPPRPQTMHPENGPPTSRKRTKR